MSQFIDFVISHWAMWALLVVILIAIVFMETNGSWFGVKLIGTQQLTELLNRQHAVLIDIRDANAYKSGHILGAKNIPETEFEGKVSTLEKYKTKPVILVCADGYHSPNIGAKLQKDQFEHVFALKGGIQVWESENLPLEV